MLKSMNWKFLIYAIFYGTMFGWMMFRAIKPREEKFHFAPKAEGEYASVIEEEEYRVEVRGFENGVVEVSFEPVTTWIHYWFFGVIGVCFGQSYYWLLVRESKKKERMQLSDQAVTTVDDDLDPEYEAFLSEDENRQLLPRPVLEGDFQKWRAERNEGHGKT